MEAISSYLEFSWIWVIIKKLSKSSNSYYSNKKIHKTPNAKVLYIGNDINWCNKTTEALEEIAKVECTNNCFYWLRLLLHKYALIIVEASSKNEKNFIVRSSRRIKWLSPGSSLSFISSMPKWRPALYALKADADDYVYKSYDTQIIFNLFNPFIKTWNGKGRKS